MVAPTIDPGGARYTQEPWKVNPLNPEWIQDKNGKAIAQIWIGYLGDLRPREKAIAEFIAAAPETAQERDRLKVRNTALAAALEGLANQVNVDYNLESASAEQREAGCFRAWRKACAVLAKEKEGEKP